MTAHVYAYFAKQLKLDFFIDLLREFTNFCKLFDMSNETTMAKP